MNLLVLSAIAAGSFFGKTEAMEMKVTVDAVKINWEMPTEKESGTMNGMEATILFNPEDLASSKITAKVDPSTNDTGNEKRDAHLSGPDFFDVEQYPEIVFESSSFTTKGDKFIAMGNLKMKGTVNPVSIPFTFSETKGGAIFTGDLRINTKSVGINFMKIVDTDKPNVMITIVVPVTM